MLTQGVSMTMNMKKKLQGFLVLVFLCLSIPWSMGQVRLPQIIRDGMVLQRDTKLNIWGWASPGEKVAVTWNGKRYRTHAGPLMESGMLTFTMKAGEPYST
ncbi:MAG: hypothetical protein U5K79_05275 [Cyclobacteriaceae bacterium]|nr:hypothetical protein [Cyclobacteriaceae bacterium]